MMKKSRAAVLLSGMLAVSILAGCGGGGAYKDGSYEGKSSVFEGEEEDGSGAGYGVVSLTIKDGKIADCTFTTYEPDGTLKDSDYGKQDGEIANQDFYNKAQRAVQASGKYAERLVEAGNLADVDSITGASISYKEFQEAVNDALDQAQGK